MSDRQLRDEVEALFAERGRERAKLVEPLVEELSLARAALTFEVAQLTERARALRAQQEALHAQLSERARETDEARAELEAARGEISLREPLGDPLRASASNWETREPGCAIGVWVVLCVAALSSAGWWLR